ncbi:hypothetical protein CONPUDRAFT_68716 [Coniophora puteana RWD-64-598 SS2]|uniref:Uncharacterized protein n=1 Tax=Coniophora puteana (strain RWD-64-598) TaxID=741705 RepID=A0A5M3N3W5_CONPW|nr:uncharacterized protein CONPUDRAFT_68716 [Coniophora puteana RWD-64-598 SS2]EIW86112.1 hypothetical protein CONPUDRAFT_68716 [Coniophora puteana RWD-64-598 SS2]
MCEGRVGFSYILDWTTLQHLTPFNKLLRINIVTFRTVALTDSEFLEMGDAWPNLVSLGIYEGNGWSGGSRLTLPGLRRFHKKLPQLTKIAIAVDGTSVSPGDIGSHHLGQFSIYRSFKLDLLDSIIGDNALKVAMYLADIFPLRGTGREKQDIRAWSLMEDSERPNHRLAALRWKKVVRIMGVFNKVSFHRPQNQLRFDGDGFYDSDGAYNCDGNLLAIDEQKDSCM